MIYAVICVLFIFFVLLLLREVSRHEPVVEFKDFEQLNNVTKGGRGISVLRYRIFLKRFYRTTTRRKEKGDVLFPFERILIDNFYLLNKTLLCIRGLNFKSMPHYKGSLRMLVLARHAISRGYDESSVQLKSFLSRVQKEIELDYREIECFPIMLSYAELEKCVYLCYRSIQLVKEKRKIRCLILKGKRVKKLQSNSFWYFYNEIGEVPDLYEGVAEDAVCSFTNTLLSYSLIAERGISVIRNEKILSRSISFDYVRADKILQKLSGYDKECKLTRKYYLSEINRLSDRLNIRESAVAELAVGICDSYKIPLGKALKGSCIKSFINNGKISIKKSVIDVVYASAVLITTVLLSLLPILFIPSPISLIYSPMLFICLLKPIEHLYRFIFSFKKKPPLYAYNYDTIPDNGKTVVVVSYYISDREGFEKGKYKIESIATNLKDKKISYCLLVDLAYNKLSDAEVEKFRELIREYNENKEGIQIALRKPLLDGDLKICRERKRGAILELFKYIKESSDMFYEIKDEIKDCVYAILLDDDSEILPSTIIKAINTIIHPMNEEYDILSFGAKINKYSITTKYSRRYSEDGSIDSYPCYNDFYSDSLGKGLFGGKGIVRISSFLKLYDIFPDGRILSHDMIEGAFLKTSSLKQCIYEDAPQNFKNDVERHFRWKKGDVLLLPYLSLKVRNRNGEKISNNIGLFYKLIILINALDCVRDFFLLISTFLGIITFNYSLIYISLAIISLPYILKLMKSLLSIGKITAFYVARDIFKEVAHLLERFFFLPYYAFEGIKVYFKVTIQSLISSKKLLEWKPFYVSQGKGNFYLYSKLFLPSKFFMTILSLISFNPYFIGFAGVYVMYAFIVYKGSYIEDPYDLGENDIIKDIFDKSFKYFDKVFVNSLPRDNIQYHPKTEACKMSSPTNFGFTLLSIISAIRAGVLDKQEGERKLFEIINALKNLERYKGHFYNWYDIEKMKPMDDKVISTADSANLCCCLLCVKGYARECGNIDLFNLAESINDTDFSFLYDEEMGLLRICYKVNESKFEGHYDVLESEAKLAYLIAISRGLYINSWFNLSRAYISYGNNTCLSWDGSAFEYMMPDIFIRPPNYSMLQLTERNAFKMHIKRGKRGYFGISEGGKFEFDENMRYQYSPDGASDLSLKYEVKGNLFNPYSVILFLPFSKGEVGKGIKAFIAKGLLCKSGLLEGIDEDNIISMQMTHHQGMIMASIANKLYDGYINNLFMSNPEIFAVRLLLAEPYIRSRGGLVYEYRVGEMEGVIPHVVSNPSLMQGCALTGSEYALGCTSLGIFKRMSKGYLITPFYPFAERNSQCATYITREGQIIPYNLYDKSTIILGGLSATYKNDVLKCEECIKILPSGCGEVRRIRIYSNGIAERVKLSHYLDICLCTEDELYSHRTFFDMFIESKVIENGATYKRVNNNMCPNLSVKVLGLNNTKVDTNKLNVCIRNKGFSEEMSIKKQEKYIFQGRVLYPCFAISGEILLDEDFYDIFIVMAVGESSEKRVELDYDALRESFDLFDRVDTKDKGRVYTFSERSANIIGKALLGFYPQNELDKRVDGKLRIVIKKEEIKNSRELQSLSLSLLRLGYDGEYLTLDNRDNEGVASEKEFAIFANFNGMAERTSNLDIIYPIKPSINLDGIKAGEGSFTEYGYEVVPSGESTLKPYSNILFSREGGVITTDNSQFSFADNSREYKLTSWYNDEINDTSSEFVYLYYKGRLYNICNCKSSVYFIENNKSVYYFSVGNIKGKIVIRVNERGNISKKVFLNGENDKCKIIFAIRPCLGYKPSNCYYAQSFRMGKIKIINKLNQLSMEMCCEKGIPFIGEDMLKGLLGGEKREPSGCLYGFVREVIAGDNEVEVECILGKRVFKKEKYIGANFGNITIATPDVRLNLLYNLFLYKQVRARLECRASFYQCGGAYGFRDQLQDCLALLYSDPERVKEHILLCASRQYEEGDVMHWWHMPMMGIRTRNTDDGLFLCYLVKRYIDRTGDRSILERKLPFIYSRTLEGNEYSRYEKPTIKRESAELRKHLMLVFNRVLDFGIHGLLLVKGGDWNDGLDKIGKEGKGESVWLSQFAYMVIANCLPLFDGEYKLNLIRSLDRLKEGINKSFKGDRFIAYYDDKGIPIGNKGDDECGLYLLTQAFACLCGAVDEDVYKTALMTGLSLVDYDYGIIKLFSPPFKKGNSYGHIVFYPEGVRENGGQYTHGAIWFICALFKAGFYDKAYELLNMINPIVRAQNDWEAYQGEPFVISADVYDGNYKGRAGWTWYTGAASWYYVLVTEYLFGLNYVEGRIFFTPRLPSFIDKGELKLKMKGSEYIFTIRKGEEDGMIENGRVSLDRYITPLENKGKVYIEVIYKDKGEKTYI